MSRALKSLLLCVSLLVAGNLTFLSAGAAAPTQTRFDDEAEECLEAVPAAASVSGVTDHGREVFLDVHLVLDEVPRERAAQVMEQAQHAYSPLGITLRTTYQMVSFPPQKMARDFELSEPVPASERKYLFDRTKEAVGGERLPHSDLVYLLTNDAILGAAGIADCIGGVRYPPRAFAIGEEQEDLDSEPICCTLATAKIAAHELAHLLGAHHHYANCAEGAVEKPNDTHLGTCTMMFNDVGLVNLRFSVVEGAVVRGHAVEFADETPERVSAAAGTHARSLTLKLSRHRGVTGRLDAENGVACSGEVPVSLERRDKDGWVRTETTVTGSDGSFAFNVPHEPGRYRAIAQEFGGGDEGKNLYTCTAASSAPITHRA